MKTGRTRAIIETLLITFVIVFIVIGVVSIPIACQAEPGIMEEEESETPEVQSVCPLTKMTDQKSCRDCHEVQKVKGGFKWGVQDDSWQDLPYGVKMVKRNGKDTMHYLLEGISAERVFEIYEYAEKNGITEVELEIDSPGGSVVAAWRIVALMQGYPKIHTTTTCYGYAASAGFTIFVSGDYRIVSPNAMLMQHELWSLKFLSIETPAGAKDEADDMRMWQDNINEWLASRSNMSVDEIADKIHKRDWWMIGREAYELGFADELAWGEK